MMKKGRNARVYLKYEKWFKPDRALGKAVTDDMANDTSLHTF